METIKRICGVCGDEYEPKRKTKMFCSDACRSKSFKNEKKAAVVSASVDEVSAIEQPGVPTKKESILNKLVTDMDSAMLAIISLVLQSENSVLIDQIAVIAIHTSIATSHNEVRKEVNSFDVAQLIHNKSAFEARTGIVSKTS